MVDSVATRPLRLEQIDEVTLGDTGSVGPKSILRFEVAPTSISVIDFSSQTLFQYNRGGALRMRFPQPSVTDGVRDPMAIAADPSGTLIGDFLTKRGIDLVDSSAKLLRHVTLPRENSTTGLVALPDLFVVASMGKPNASSKDGSLFAYVMSRRTGEIVARGCPMDERYMASMKRRGSIATFRDFGVSVLADTVYCRQPISPVVSKFTLGGERVGSIRVQPDIYIEPKDRFFSGSAIDMNAFKSAWTEHMQFLPFSDGFVSVYATYDTSLQRATRWVVRCRRAAKSYDCESAKLTARAVWVSHPDTVFTADYLSDRDARLVVRTLVTR